MTRAPERIETARIMLRRPRREDAEAIFSRYASDPEVTRFLAFPTHRSIHDTYKFLDSSDADWTTWGVGPYLIELRALAGVIGSTGLMFLSDEAVQTGYVLAKDAWGHGYATEALHAMVNLAGDLHVRLTALCHVEHTASQNVLIKCGFTQEPGLHAEHLPNLDSGCSADCWRYVFGS